MQLPYTPPLTRKYFKEFLRFVNRGEPFTLLGMYDGGQDYIFSLLATLDRKYYKRKVFIFNVQNADLITEEFESKLNIKIEDGLLGFKNTELLQKGLSIVFFLAPWQKLPRSLENLLHQLRITYPWRFSYHFIGYTTLYTHFDGARDNIYLRRFKPKKLLDKENSEILVRMYEDAYSLKLNTEQREFVVRHAGGNPGLIKSLVFQQANGAGDQIDFSDPDLLERIGNIIKLLPKDVVLQLIGKKRFTVKAQKFLQMFDYIKADGEFFAPWILDWLIVDESMREYLKTLELTPQQERVYKFFKMNKGRLITRRELAKFLWGDDYLTKYSDWAIDRLISDLRRKLDGVLHIETKKRKGFIIF